MQKIQALVQNSIYVGLQNSFSFHFLLHLYMVHSAITFSSDVNVLTDNYVCIVYINIVQLVEYLIATQKTNFCGRQI